MHASNLAHILTPGDDKLCYCGHVITHSVHEAGEHENHRLYSEVEVPFGVCSTCKFAVSLPSADAGDSSARWRQLKDELRVCFANMEPIDILRELQQILLIAKDTIGECDELERVLQGLDPIERFLNDAD